VIRRIMNLQAVNTCEGIHDIHALILGRAQRSLTSLREKLIKIGAKVVSHSRYVTFQVATVAV
jgi:hypothetical protein